jgi:hypothetical protein
MFYFKLYAIGGGGRTDVDEALSVRENGLDLRATAAVATASRYAFCPAAELTMASARASLRSNDNVLTLVAQVDRDPK